MQFAACRSSILQRRILQQQQQSISSSSSSLLVLSSSATQISSCMNISSFAQNMNKINNTNKNTNCCSISSSASASMIVVAPYCNTSVRTAIQEVRSGDWLCANCGENNFRFRTSCNLCSKPRAGGSGMEDKTSSSLENNNNNSNNVRQGRGGGSANANTGSAGDWQCPVCQCLNFKFRSECFSCREARPASERPPKGIELTEANMKPGDWKCTECSAINFRGRNNCFTCRSPRSPNAMTAGGAGAGSRLGSGRNNSKGAPAGAGGNNNRRPTMKAGDWLCQSCSELNFADRAACFRCGQARGDAKGYQPAGGAGGRPAAPKGKDGLSEEVMAGDWMCADCGTNNFRRRNECVKCKKPKPAPAATESASTTPESAENKNLGEKLQDPVDDL